MSEDFWKHDRTTLHKTSWFAKLSVKQRIGASSILAFIIAWCFFIGFSVAGATMPDLMDNAVTGKTALQDDVNLISQEGIMTILMVGCDARENLGSDVGRTDTIILAFVDADNKTLRLLSIPRDTYVRIPGTSTKTKINHAYAYGGIPLTTDTIENFLGVDIDHYVEIDFNGFKDVIDQLGGVTINVESRMKKLSEGIDLYPGEQKLNGTDALAYVRYREPTYADIGRIGRQQQFLYAVANQVKDSSILKKAKVIKTIYNYTNTDISMRDATALAEIVYKMDLTKMEMYTVPGDGQYINGVSYWIVDSTQLSNIITYLMGGEYDGDINALSGNSSSNSSGSNNSSDQAQTVSTNNTTNASTTNDNSDANTPTNPTSQNDQSDQASTDGNTGSSTNGNSSDDTSGNSGSSLDINNIPEPTE